MLYRLFVNRAVAFDKIVFGEISLTRNAVQPAVLVEFDISVVVTRLQQLLDADAVTLFSRTNEIVITDIEFLPSISKKWCD